MKKIIFIFVISIILIIFCYFNSNFFIFLRGEIFKIVDGVSGNLANSFKFIWSIKDIYNENENLKAQIRQLEIANTEIKQLQKENKDLKSALNFDSDKYYKKILSLVLGREQSSFNNILILDKGFKDGVINNIPVVNYSGELIGVIDGVEENFSKVRLLNDKSFSLPSEIINEEDIRGVVKGTLQGVIMDFIMPDKNISIGDLISASNFGNLVFKELPIGTVEKIISVPSDSIKKVKIKLFADLTSIKSVFILLSPIKYK